MSGVQRGQWLWSELAVSIYGYSRVCVRATLEELRAAWYRRVQGHGCAESRECVSVCVSARTAVGVSKTPNELAGWPRCAQANRRETQ